MTRLPDPIAKTCRPRLARGTLRRRASQDFEPRFRLPLMNFQIRRSIPLFGLSAPRPFPQRGRPAQTVHSDHGF